MTFTNVVLREHKGVQGGELVSLAKINVICGPNNSGKSSVLECLADPKRHYRGRPFSEDLVETFHKAYLSGSNWTQSRFEDAFREAASRAFAQRPIWYENGSREFYEELNAGYNARTGTHLDRRDRIENNFKGQFGTAPTTVLVPAKRKLLGETAINSPSRFYQMDRAC